MKPSDCPRYERCNAPICPLDPHCLHSQHLPGESVCLWLRELSKPHGEDTLRSVLREEVAATVMAAAPGIIATHGCVRRAWQRASRHGSKLASGRALGPTHETA
jgi:hypothetical protein